MPDPGSPWERPNPSDGFGYLPWPIKTAADKAKWDECRIAEEARAALKDSTPAPQTNSAAKSA
jgi:hypothetical protein